MIEKLKKCNKDISIYSVFDKEFLPYGRVIKSIDVTEMISSCKAVDFPKIGSKYDASLENLEKLSVFKEIKEELFGGLDIEIGACRGYNCELNAFEYHKSSEVNVAVTPFVLILGLEMEITDGKYNSENAKAFLVDKGTVIEVYGTTLHFCPCQVCDDGFFSIVVLPRGTNEPLDFKPTDKYLFRKNKWLLAHCDNEALGKRGAVMKLFGENYKINY